MSKKKEVGDGPAQFYVTTDPKNGLVLINFDKPILWFALTAETASKLGEDLLENAKRIKPLRLPEKYCS